MRDRYTYERISEATEMFLLGVERNDSNARISEDTGICQTRIKTWKHRYNIIARRYQAEDRRCLQFISNLTYGVSEDVWNRWLCAIDERLEEIRNCGGLSNDIRTILEEIADGIDTAVRPKRGTNVEMIDNAVAHFVNEAERSRQERYLIHIQMETKSYILKREEFLSKGKLINKFMPLERALSLLETKAIWFANPETWPDPYEKYFLCAKYGSKEFQWRGRIFCTCFTNNASSEASWNAYSKNEICVRLTFRGDRLLYLLDDYQKKNPRHKVFFDKVQYRRTNTMTKKLSDISFDPLLEGKFSLNNDESKVRLMLLKRKAFSYEDEYRAMIVKPQSTKERGLRFMIPNINELVSSVCIDPRAGEYTFKMLKKYLKVEYGFPSRGIQQSWLYKDINPKMSL